MASTDHAPLIPDGAVYVTARQLAHRYQVSLKWITARAALLGATPISEAPNSPLRYHLPTADAYLASRRRAPAPSARAVPRTRSAPDLVDRRTTRSGAPLLDFR